MLKSEQTFLGLNFVEYITEMWSIHSLKTLSNILQSSKKKKKKIVVRKNKKILNKKKVEKFVLLLIAWYMYMWYIFAVPFLGIATLCHAHTPVRSECGCGCCLWSGAKLKVFREILINFRAVFAGAGSTKCCRDQKRFVAEARRRYAYHVCARSHF